MWEWPSTVLLDGYVRSDDFGTAALRMAEAVRAEADDATYLERWGHYASLEGFPLRAMTALSTALSVKEYRAG